MFSLIINKRKHLNIIPICIPEPSIMWLDVLFAPLLGNLDTMTCTMFAKLIAKAV